jgi:hypothetical protein
MTTTAGDALSHAVFAANREARFAPISASRTLLVFPNATAGWSSR